MSIEAEHRLTFNWVVDGFLAGSSRPGDAGAPLADDLEFLRGRRIDAIVSLTEEPLDSEAVRDKGLDYLHVFCHDGQPPANLQMLEMVRFIEAQRAAGRRVLVHCMAGFGRTSTAMAAYLIGVRGIEPDDAIRRVVENRLGPGLPGPMITAAQEEGLREFAEWCRQRTTARIKKGS
jgi:atypical dual specificity phosphatase